MGKQIPITQAFTMPDGTEITIETGKLAAQSNGSCVIQVGKMMIFASVVSATEAREGQPFFPLSVDYQEKFAAAGRIPGNFFKREARLSDHEILCCRLVDRAIRPLFPDGYMNDTQVIINLISAQEDITPDAYVALAASTALAISPIPWNGPLSEVRVIKHNGEYIVNPKKDLLAEAELNIIIAATDENVMMVEGDAKEVDEADLIEAIKVGHAAIKVQCKAQLDLAKKVGDKAMIKREFISPVLDAEVKELVKGLTKDKIYEVSKGALEKHIRKERFTEIKTAMKESLVESQGEEWMEEHGGMASKCFEKLKKEVIRTMVVDEGVRLDGRKLDVVRDIWTEVDYLPSTHGSAIFTRGETQALTSLTLGSKMDQQMIDTAMDHYYEKFILHYNFPAYSVGEIKMMRGPGRREVGHANLAARSLKQVLPEDSPYTIRIVSDILESNGSSSMATVCAGSMSLMDAGIKIKAAVSGIAMGMIAEGDKMAVLSDILGDEDAIGDMDFKVTGTEKGICACQMDIKIDGLPYSTLEKALEQAKAGRLHILKEMAKTMSEPRAELKPHAPRMEKILIDKSYIGAVIGPGGKIIQEIQEVTGATITIEELDGKGHVHISSNDADSLAAARARINDICFEPSVGDIYDARVASIMPYGAFVDFKGKSGLLHVSEIAHTRVENVEDVLSVGDELQVKIIGIDERSGKMKLSRKVLLEKT